MRVYVSGKFEERTAIRKIMDAIEKNGHTIVHDWTQEDVCETDRDRRERAMMCLLSIPKAEVMVVVMYTNAPYKGTYVEMGIALAANVPIYILGNPPKSCIFTSLCPVQSRDDLLTGVLKPCR